MEYLRGKSLLCCIKTGQTQPVCPITDTYRHGSFIWRDCKQAGRNSARDWRGDPPPRRYPLPASPPGRCPSLAANRLTLSPLHRSEHLKKAPCRTTGHASLSSDPSCQALFSARLPLLSRGTTCTVPHKTFPVNQDSAGPDQRQVAQPPHTSTCAASVLALTCRSAKARGDRAAQSAR